MKKNTIIIAVLAVLVIISIGLFFLSRQTTNSSGTAQGNSLPSSNVVPTVDASVKVDLKAADASKHEMILSIDGIPNDTKTIDYMLTYDTVERGSQGVLGEGDSAITVTPGQKSYTKKYLIGTESSGKKLYDTLSSPVHVSLKFNGSYGVKTFDKDFKL